MREVDGDRNGQRTVACCIFLHYHGCMGEKTQLMDKDRAGRVM